MKCAKCPLFTSWNNESDRGERCGLFGDSWDDACCGECPCFYAEHPMRCQADSRKPKRTHGAPYAGKPDWCPLVELPVHGDLIDLSAKVDCQYYDEMYEEWSVRTVTVEDVLRGCLEKMPPVIVPASEEANHENP